MPSGQFFVSSKLNIETGVVCGSGNEEIRNINKSASESHLPNKSESSAFTESKNKRVLIRNFLSEARLKLDAVRFKDFCSRIRLLSSSEETSCKNDVIKSIKKIFGEENKGLFEKLQSIMKVMNG